MKTFVPALTLLLSAATAVFAQDAKGIKIENLANADLSLMVNHDPAAEHASFDLLPGYEVNLFAAEPMLARTSSPKALLPM